MDVLSCYIADERDLAEHVKGFSVNSDYSPFVEFTTDRNADPKQIFSQFVVDVRSDSLYDHIDWTGFSEEQKDKYLADFKHYERN